MATPARSLELTQRGGIVLALALTSTLAAWLTGDPHVRIAAGMLFAPLLVDFAQKPRGLGALGVQVRPRRTIAGAPFRDEIQLRNARGRSLRELIVTENSMRSRSVLVEALNDRATVHLDCHGPVRGHLLERVFSLVTEWPLGLFRACATAVVATDFVAEPRRVRIDAWLRRAATDQHAGSQTQRQLAGDEFHALREHGAGEDARGVHALRSAALGHLVRTVTHGRLPRHVGVVIDLRRPPGRRLHDGSRRFEWSLGACATLLDALRAHSASLRLIVIGSRTIHATIHDDAQLRNQLTLLAELAPSPHRALEPEATERLQQLEQCFWVPAGGYLTAAEQVRLQPRPMLVGAEDE